uniref:GTP cyclohydrolase folE2 n=1 Tax=Lygus hesperus TaxID=30085 RepID=A0A0A9Z9C4_LYGHE
MVFNSEQVAPSSNASAHTSRDVSVGAVAEIGQQRQLPPQTAAPNHGAVQPELQQEQWNSDEDAAWDDGDSDAEWFDDTEDIEKLHQIVGTPKKSAGISGARFDHGTWVSEDLDEDTLELLSIEDFGTSNAATCDAVTTVNTDPHTPTAVDGTTARQVSTQLIADNKTALQDIDSFLDMDESEDETLVTETTSLGRLHSIPSNSSTIDPL